jgi:hypothetical protein
MLFNLHSYLIELSENPVKSEITTKYKKLFGSLPKLVQDAHWYIEYVSKFKMDDINYRIPQELEGDFDWDLLARLALASFSNRAYFELEQGGLQLYITVTSGDQCLTKKVSDLWGFQILRLFEIYTEEQMNLAILSAEDEKEKAAIFSSRDRVYFDYLKSTTEINHKIETDKLLAELGIWDETYSEYITERPANVSISLTNNEKIDKMPKLQTIQIRESLYDSIQKLKAIISQMSGQEVIQDEDVLSILIGGFVESLKDIHKEI